MKNSTIIIWLLAAVLISGRSTSWSQEKEEAVHGGHSEVLGEVNFPVSCNTSAQKEFNRAMALFHSFWFDPAKKSFAKVAQYDPGCGMAYWGIAFMSLGNVFAWPPNPKAMKAGEEALAEFERSLKRDPNRFRGVYGAAQAAEAVGDRERARLYYGKLLALTEKRDTERPEITRAKVYMARP